MYWGGYDRSIVHFINLNFGSDFLQRPVELLAKDCYVSKLCVTFILHTSDDKCSARAQLNRCN